MIRISIEDGATPLLDKILELNYGMALDALDNAGIILRDNTRKAFKASTTKISQGYTKDGRWYVRGGYGKAYQQNIGIRLSHQNKGGFDATPDMASFITSNLMEKHLTMVVAGKHGKLRPKIRRDGKVIKSANSVGSVTKGSYAILQKLNYGDDSDPEYEKVHRTKQQAEFFKNAKWKRQGFIEKGRKSSMGRVNEIMTSKLEALLQREYNRANTKGVKVA